MIKLHIPTPSPLSDNHFAFVEIEIELQEAALPEINDKYVKSIYDKYIQTFQSENKYSESKFNEMIAAIMDSDITEWQISTDDYQHLTESQQKVMQAIKRLKKRLDYAAKENE